MTDNMPNRHSIVKNNYSGQPLEGKRVRWHNMPMDRVREIRVFRGLTQADLADVSGLNQGFLSKVESGAANPSLDKIKVIAKALRVEPYELFAPSDLKGRALLALGEMDDGTAEAALVVLQAMVGRKTPR